MPDGHIRILTAPGAITNANEPAFNITSNAEWRLDMAPSIWVAAGTQTLAARYDHNTPRRVWQIILHNAAPRQVRVLLGNADGTGARTFQLPFSATNGTAAEFVDGQRVQLRVRVTANNGSGGTTITLHSRAGANLAALSDDANWTLESTTTQSGTQTWLATDLAVRWGSSLGDLSHTFGGYFGFRWWGSLDKTNPILAVDFTNPANSTNPPTYSSWDDAISADHWTIAGTKGTSWDYVEPPVAGQTALPTAVLASTNWSAVGAASILAAVAGVDDDASYAEGAAGVNNAVLLLELDTLDTVQVADGTQSLALRLSKSETGGQTITALVELLPPTGSDTVLASNTFTPPTTVTLYDLLDGAQVASLSGQHRVRITQQVS